MVAWVFANPPGAAADEPANDVKAIAAGRGELLGRPGTLPPAVVERYGMTGPRYAFASATTRWVHIPPPLAPVGFGCTAFHAERAATCLNEAATQPANDEQPTYTGTYQPFVYLFPGALARFAHDPITALWLIRLGNALLCLALVAGAAWLLTSTPAMSPSLLGLLMAVTPMVIFSSAIVSASGPEICAGIAFYAAILRLARPAPMGRVEWLALAASGVVLALSRPVGVVWIGLGLGFLALIGNPATLLARFRAGFPWSVIGGSALALAVTLSLGWEALVEPHPHLRLADSIALLPSAIWNLPDNFRQMVGVFGWVDSYMPTAAYGFWDVAMLALIATAFLLGSPRQRRVLALMIVALVGVSLLVALVILMPNGFALQGRYVMALGVAIPLFAAEVVALHAHRLRALTPARLFTIYSTVAALMQGLGWYYNARRYATGLSGPLNFLSGSAWSPQLGWLPWLLLTAVGCLAVLAVGAVASARAHPVTRHAPRIAA